MGLFLDTIAGARTPRRPLWIMRQAGRYLPEYRALRAEHRFEELCADPELAARATLLPLARFDLDAAVIFADLMSPVAALGLDFCFDPGPVIASPVRSRDDVERLATPEPANIAPEVLETIGRVREELPREKAVLGFGGAPWSIAAYLVEGRGRSGFPQLRAMAARDPELLATLLTKLSDLVAVYLCDQAKAGADAVQIFDTWAGIVDRESWERLARPSLKSLLERVGRVGVPRILFARGAPHLIDQYMELPCEVLAVDWMTDLAALRARCPATLALQGNIDPAILLAGPGATRVATTRLLEQVPFARHIVNLGHGILPETPIESVEALIEIVHNEANS